MKGAYGLSLSWPAPYAATGFLRPRPHISKGYNMATVPFDVDGFELVLRELAHSAFQGMPPTERLAGFQAMFEGAVRRGEDKLAAQAVQCWSLAFKDAQPMQDQQKTELAKLDMLTSMFFVVHEQYKARDYQGMTEALLAVFREILALWHPWMWGSCRKAFEFCAAIVAGMSSSSGHDGWTNAMHLMKDRHIRKEERGIMITLIQEKANNEKNHMDSFDEEALEKWIDAYAFSTHFPEKVMTALSTACARKGGTCRARDEVVRREVCGRLDRLSATRPLRKVLVRVVRQWTDFSRRMQNAFSSEMWGKLENMATDERGKDVAFYGEIIIRYVSLTAVQVDVVLPVDLSQPLCGDMQRRAEEHARHFRTVMGKEVAIMIRISCNDLKSFLTVSQGESFDGLPLAAEDLAVQD